MAIDTARYGGDEFAIILPETGAKEADAVARRICQWLANDHEEPCLSVSVGIWPDLNHRTGLFYVFVVSVNRMFKFEQIFCVVCATKSSLD